MWSVFGGNFERMGNTMNWAEVEIVAWHGMGMRMVWCEVVKRQKADFILRPVLWANMLPFFFNGMDGSLGLEIRV